MLLHMGVQHHWWHLALRQAVWVRNCLEWSTLLPGTTPYQVLTGKKPDLSLACVWGCMAQFLVLEQQRGGKLHPKARWGLHLGILEESKGWELLDIVDNRVVTTSDVEFYENMSSEVWKSEHGPAMGRTPTIPPTDTSTATLPLLAKVGEPAAEDVEDIPSPFPSSAPCAPPLLADLRGLTTVSASGNEGRRGASPVAPAKSIDGGRHDVQQVDVRVMSTPPGEEQSEEVQPVVVKSAKGAGTRQQLTGEQAAAKLTKKQSATRQSAEEPTTGEKLAGKPPEVQLDDEGSEAGDDGGDAKDSTDSDVVEVQRGPRQSGRIRRPPDFYVPAAFTTAYDKVDDDLQYDDAKEDEDFPELDPDMHADPEHRWVISMMTVKEALASWKGKAVKAAMEEEICSLVSTGTWELVERSPGVNIMKNRWVLTTKYHIDDTVEQEKARLVVKGFTQVYGANYDETYALVSSYVTLRIFLRIVAVLDLNLMQLDMKNAFLQNKLDRALNGVLLGAGWKKSQVDMVTCWVLVYVDDLLAASSSAAMLKELLQAAFDLWEILPVQKYLGLEIVRDRSVRKLWLHQQGYADKLRTGAPGGGVPIEGRLATVRGDDDEAGHRLRLQQAGEWPHCEERPALARGRPLPRLPRQHPTGRARAATCLSLEGPPSLGGGTTEAGGAGSAGAGRSAPCGTGVRRQETLSPERLREWAIQWGSPGGGASRARTTRAGGAGTPGAARAAGGAAAGSPGGGAGRGGAAVSGGASPGGASPGGASAGVPGTGDTGAAGGTGHAGAAGGTGGAGPGGASTSGPRVGRAGGTGTGGVADTRGTPGCTTGGTGVSGASRQESLSPLQLHEWAVRWGSPSGGAGGTVSGGATTQPQPSALRHLLSLLPTATEFQVAGTTPPLLFPPTDQSQP
ncbi:unnamed protein product [Closterium sp. NIES-54]